MKSRRSSLAVALGALLVTLAGCRDAVQPEPPVVQPPALPPVAPPAPPFPALSRPGEIYHEGNDIYAGSNAYHGGRITSRYVLYEDSTFELQFSSSAYGFFAYTGRYSRADSLITFNFDANAGTWQADGTVRGDSLVIKYNLDMSLSDFVDGVYVRSPHTP